MLVCIILLIVTDDRDIRFIVGLFLTVTIVVFSFASGLVIGYVMNRYEEGTIVKEYTIINQDTTYRWILKE